MDKRSHRLRRQLLRLLADGEFHSGEELGKVFGISRAGIAKHIKFLGTLGLEVFSVTGKGYRLSQPIELLDVASIANACEENAPSPIVLPFVDSTNNYVKSLPKANLDKGQCVIAECQTSGRGRRGKDWQSPFAENLYFSLYWRLDQGISAAMGLSLVVGVCVAQVLKQFKVTSGLKWPNDVYVDHKKVAGILVELDGQPGEPCDVTIGIGINVKMSEKSVAAIDQPWTDLSNCLSQPVDRNLLASCLLDTLVRQLTRYDTYGFAPFVPLWDAYDIFKEQAVNIFIGDKIEEGVYKGINSQGGIIVRQGSGERVYYGGEISLRKQNVSAH